MPCRGGPLSARFASHTCIREDHGLRCLSLRLPFTAPPAGWAAGWWPWPAADPQFRVVAAVDSPTHPDLGRDAGMLAGIKDLACRCRRQAAGREAACRDRFFRARRRRSGHRRLRQRGRFRWSWPRPGSAKPHKERLREAAKVDPDRLVAQHEHDGQSGDEARRAGRADAEGRRGGVDVEIIERHHRMKEDSPSGTALKFGEIIAGRDGPDRASPRPPGADRQAAAPARSAITPSAPATIPASTRSSSACSARRWKSPSRPPAAIATRRRPGRGEVRRRQQPGLYSMYDVLGL